MTFWKTVGAVMTASLIMTCIWASFYAIVLLTLTK